ncbi:hypothetical protein [Halpernia sp.]|uniref:hypothetical protein n=1 Tax=Halpernia sp. TaxID=2782209 RepID=UPI003A8E4BD7
MAKRLILVLSFIFIGQITKAQLTTYTMLQAGYVYQNQSFAELGGRFLFLNNDNVIYRLGASAMIGSANSKIAVLPKLQGDILLNFEKNVDLYHAYYFLAGAEVTSKYFAPKLGVSLFGIVDLSGGYAFPMSNKTFNGKDLKGFNLNFTVNLPFLLLRDLLK